MKAKKTKRTAKFTEGELERAMLQFLEEPHWLASLKSKVAYARLHDDHDGTFVGSVCITFGDDGDAWLDHAEGSLRFRSEFGGGRSPRVRAALMILAWAIKLDSQERPD